MKKFAFLLMLLLALGMSAAVADTCGDYEYWAWDGRHLGAWHEPAQLIKPGVEVGKAAQM